jgi:glutamate 5-kinase
MFSAAKTIVVKIGSAILVDEETQSLREDWLAALAADLAGLKDKRIVLVSSGAIALGRQRLKLYGSSLSLPEKQACAAAGQSSLTRAYDDALGQHDLMTAQALLTLNDTENRRRWLNARSTLDTLLGLGVVPIINENDSVATEEIRYGDNDRLAARTAQMIGADLLVLLSDIDGLYTADPRTNPAAVHIPIIEDLTENIMTMGGAPNAAVGVGTGGMATKLAAAQIATQAGCDMVICDGRSVGALATLGNGAKHSRFKANSNPRKARAQWIGGTLKPSGALHIDAGAVKALRNGSSLLPAGVTGISGVFEKGDALSILADDVEIARGLVAYDVHEAVRIKGLKSDEILSTLGYANGAAMVHRDNLVML